jgi:putative oxidoreductase
MPMNPSIAEHRIVGRRVITETDSDEVIRDSLEHPTMALIGRFLMAAIFVVSGVGKLTDIAGTAAHMTQAGIPYAETLAMVAGVAELAGAFAIATGFLTRAGGLGLILFMIPATVIFHAFWKATGDQRLPQIVNFMKNLAIIGGLATLVAFGAGRFSIDHALHRARR